MKEIILNEREYAERLLEEYSLGKDEYVSICILAKYWRAKGLIAPKIRRQIEDHILRSRPYTQVFRYEDMINSAITASKKWPLIQLESVNITQSEIDTIKSLYQVQEQQLLFAMVCLAKYRHAVNQRSDGWINTPRNDVYKFANVAGSLDRRTALQRNLHDAGLIEWPRRADSENVRVTFCDYTGEAAIRITDFRNLGYQWRQYLGEPYFACSECGIVIRKNSNRMKYCKDCAEEINRRNARERWFMLA